MKVTFKLASEPGVPNRNGVVYSKESFDKMLNSDYTQELLKNNCLFITKGETPIVYSSDNYRKFCVSAEDCIGRVTEWEGRDVKGEILREDYAEILEELMKQDKLELGMNYYCRLVKHNDGTTEPIAMKIHSMSIINKDTGTYL